MSLQFSEIKFGVECGQTQIKHDEIQNALNNKVKNFGLIQLESIYLGMSNYYFNPQTNEILEHENTRGVWSVVPRNSQFDINLRKHNSQ